jgi:Protein of unknown function (DUF3073)
MGRGRAKAKQTKVARELKYHTPDTDFSALQRELASPGGGSPFRDSEPSDPYADDVGDEWDDEGRWASGSQR